LTKKLKFSHLLILKLFQTIILDDVTRLISVKGKSHMGVK